MLLFIKSFKDCVIVHISVISIGSHWLSLLLIGRTKIPRGFRNVKRLLLMNKNQLKAWMTTALFSEWFYKMFFLDEKVVGKDGNMLLILDMCQAILQ